VGRGDGGDDRKAQTRSSAAPALLGAAEALEGSWCELGWKARSLVGHVELEPIAVPDSQQADCPLSVPNGVVDEIA
jgi:hypothetical protein